MRRGNKFETQINKIIKYVNSIGGHAHKNHAERTIDGTYIKGEPFDYEIFLKNYKACFDAKEIQGTYWNLKKKDIIQTENLKHCKNTGMKAYFLIYNDSKVKMLDVDIVIKNLKNGKKSVSLDDLPTWDLIEVLGGKINEERI